MCGIVGAVAQRDIAAILLEGLKRLEYRGYDSAGLSVTDKQGINQRIRRVGKVQALADAVAEAGAQGGTGIAHTRWATHGEPNENNAHPHLSNDRITIVHNGIIENHEELRVSLTAKGYAFVTDTDSEVICHLINEELKNADSLVAAVQKAVVQLHGAYGTVVMDNNDPDRLVVARSGSPLVIGYGIGEHFVASDQLALLPVTRRFAFLEEGDVAEVTREAVKIFDCNGIPVEREITESTVSHDTG
ncbi:MAG: class II glutamine amidotransferase, partial [Pseudomonadales bacterium]|nr:class II glutamine amidotransferase [Pseudomonadales bacterium]